jgi:3-oxoacyl-(acyl-carrier-protein) synthase
MNPSALPRVVVTGMGALTPLGGSVRDSWNAMLAGISGAAPITHFDASTYDTTFACEVKGFDVLTVMDRKQAKRLDPVCHYAMAAAREALIDAGLTPDRMSDELRDSIGVVFGSGIGGITTFQEQTSVFVQKGHNRVSPFFIPMLIPDMSAGVISIEFGLRGPNHCLRDGQPQPGRRDDADPERTGPDHRVRWYGSGHLRRGRRRLLRHEGAQHAQRFADHGIAAVRRHA